MQRYSEQAFNGFHLIWADKAALFVALAFSSLIGVAWLFAFLAAGQAGASHLFDGMGAQMIKIDLVTALSVWIVLRAINFAFHAAAAHHLAAPLRHTHIRHR